MRRFIYVFVVCSTVLFYCYYDVIMNKVMMYQDKDNEEQLCLNLDLIDKVRTDAEERTTRYKNLMARQYDAMVKSR